MIIYKCTNLINGKIYIGLTKHNLESRRKQHRIDYNYNLPINEIAGFYGAVKKYGWENFKWEVLENCSSVEELYSREIHWIKFYRDVLGIKSVYNINDGGNGGDNYSNNPNLDEIKKRISNGVKKSNRWTDEKKLVQSESTKKRWGEGVFNVNNSFINNNPMKDEKLRQKQLAACRTKEQREKLSECAKRRKPLSEKQRKDISDRLIGRIVSQETKNRISVSNQGRIISQEHRDKISKAHTGKVVSAETKEKMSLAGIGRPKSIETRKKLSDIRSKDWWVQFNKNTLEIINIFNSGCEISRITGFESSNLVDKDLFPTQSPYGYKWKRFKKNEISKEELYKLFGKSL